MEAGGSWLRQAGERRWLVVEAENRAAALQRHWGDWRDGWDSLAQAVVTGNCCSSLVNAHLHSIVEVHD